MFRFFLPSQGPSGGLLRIAPADSYEEPIEELRHGGTDFPGRWEFTGVVSTIRSGKYCDGSVEKYLPAKAGIQSAMSIADHNSGQRCLKWTKRITTLWLIGFWDFQTKTVVSTLYMGTYFGMFR